MEKYESRLHRPVRLRMDGKSLNLVVHVVSFISRAYTCEQCDDREVVYSENGAFATTSAKLGDVYPSTYRTPKSRTMLSKVDSGFRRAMLQRHSLSPFLNARRGNSASSSMKPILASRRPPISVVILGVPPVEELDLIGPLEVFAGANRVLGARGPAYDVRVVSSQPQPIIAGQCGVSLLAHGYYRRLR